MLFSPRARNRDLAELCRRMSISIESGIDLRRILEREAQGHLPSAMRRRLIDIRAAVAQATSLSDAIDATGSYFPPLFRELVRVGEQTGHLDEVFAQLAENYEHQETMRREFLSSVSWPLIQLTLAIFVIGLVIWVSGFIGGRDLNGRPIDLLGFGLKGTPGLITYSEIVGSIVFGVLVLIQAMKRGVFWLKPIQRAALYMPKLGGALQTLAVARFAWSLSLTTESGMGILKALPLCVNSMQNATYTDQARAITESVRAGNTLTETLVATHVFPPRFLDALDVGERSGRLPEAMQLLTRQYQDEARRAIKILMQIAAWMVSIAVMAFIVFFIFRLFSFYLGMLNNAMKM